MGQITRGGAVVLIQAGDAAISGALASGALAAIEARGGLTEGQRKTVEAEIDRQAIQRDMSVDRHLLRVAVGNTKTAEDYASRCCQAGIDYGESVYFPTPLERIATAALKIYAMFVCAVSTAYHAQDKLMEG
jgi:hypothetical protein